MRYFLRYSLFELKMLLVSPITYLASFLFLLLMGVIYVFIIQEYAQAPQDDLPTVVFLSSFWIPVFFAVPLLTMRSIAEERRLGTLETLMTTPITALEVVLAKFFAIYLFYVFLWALTLCYPFIAIWSLGSGASVDVFLDIPSLVGGYLFIFLSGLLYVAIGIFSSSLTRSQLVAGMLSFGALFFVIVGARFIVQWPSLNDVVWAKNLVDYLQTFQQLEDFSRGILDTRPLVFYLSNTFVVLGITSWVVKAKTA